MSYLTHAVCSHARRRLCGYNACALRKVGRVSVTLGIARVMQVRAHAQWHLAVHCLTCESPHACTYKLRPVSIADSMIRDLENDVRRLDSALGTYR